MDFTILAVVLLIGVGVPIRNKLMPYLSARDFSALTSL